MTTTDNYKEISVGIDLAPLKYFQLVSLLRLADTSITHKYLEK